MSKAVIGVDIGATAVRAAEVADSGKRHPELRRYAEVPLPDGVVKDGTVVDARHAAAALRELWKRGRFTSRQVALGVGNKRVMVRETSMPSMPLEQLRESLPFQVQDMIPVAVSDALLDFYPVSETSTAQGLMVNGLLVAAIKDPVQANVDAIREAGLTPAEVDLIPFAQTRALARRGENSKQPVALIDVGAHTTNVVIVARGVPQFVRIIASGGDEVTTALSTTLGMATGDADRLKRVVGIRPTDVPEARRASEVIASVVNPLLVSLRDTVGYYNNANPGDPIRRIVVSGGGAQLPGFADGLAAATQTQVTGADPLTDVTAGSAVDRDAIAAARSTLVIALGLAMGDDDES